VSSYHGDKAMTTLGDLLREAKRETGLGLGDLTVLSPQNDPFRIDTPTFHEAGRWFADQLERLDLYGKHLRGIHYALLGSTAMPNGAPYHNTAESWDWLQDVASKAGRWLGYVEFDAIRDQRNTAPVSRAMMGDRFEPTPILRVIPELYLPDDLTPRVELADFMPAQAYHLVFWGEKVSLDDVLGPLATTYNACLYLPTGESSDTMLAQMAREGAQDGRPMVVLVCADCDPAGYQMATSIGHKLRALKEALYASLDFKVVVPALTVEQVKELDLPSTPLKETERRASKWRAAYGVEQTEVDALATLRPDELRRIMRQAVRPYWDASLEDRARRVRDEWEATAQAAFEEQVDAEQMAALRTQAEEAVENLKARLADLDLATEDLEINWPSVDMPLATCTGDGPNLVSSDMPLTEAIRTLRARKRYTD
jgi:hypothetical protein